MEDAVVFELLDSDGPFKQKDFKVARQNFHSVAVLIGPEETLLSEYAPPSDRANLDISGLYCVSVLDRDFFKHSASSIFDKVGVPSDCAFSRQHITLPIYLWDKVLDKLGLFVLVGHLIYRRYDGGEKAPPFEELKVVKLFNVIKLLLVEDHHSAIFDS